MRRKLTPPCTTAMAVEPSATSAGGAVDTTLAAVGVLATLGRVPLPGILWARLVVPLGSNPHRLFCRRLGGSRFTLPARTRRCGLSQARMAWRWTRHRTRRCRII